MEAIGKQIALDLINTFKFSSEDNTAKERLANDTVYALGDGDKFGLTADYHKAIKAISFATSDMNTVCMPCENNQFRVRSSTVYR